MKSDQEMIRNYIREKKSRIITKKIIALIKEIIINYLLPSQMNGKKSRNNIKKKVNKYRYQEKIQL